MIQIYHNPRCTKSRECLAFIEESGKDFEVVKYLDEPPTFEKLKEIIAQLNSKPIDVVRQKEKIWITNYKGKEMTEDEIIQAMIDYPILIERPIVLYEGKAIIARPFAKVTTFI